MDVYLGRFGRGSRDIGREKRGKMKKEQIKFSCLCLALLLTTYSFGVSYADSEDTEIPVIIKSSYVTKFTVLDFSIDPQNVPSKVPFKKKEDERYIRLIGEMVCATSLMPEEDGNKVVIPSKVTKLQIEDNYYHVAGEHLSYAGIWGGAFKVQALPEKDECYCDVEFYFIVPQNIQLKNARLIIE